MSQLIDEMEVNKLESKAEEEWMKFIKPNKTDMLEAENIKEKYRSINIHIINFFKKKTKDELVVITKLNDIDDTFEEFICYLFEILDKPKNKNKLKEMKKIISSNLEVLDVKKIIANESFKFKFEHKCFASKIAEEEIEKIFLVRDLSTIIHESKNSDKKKIKALPIEEQSKEEKISELIHNSFIEILIKHKFKIEYEPKLLE